MITDKTIMTFGKHQGLEMQDVPASWLLWFREKQLEKIDNNERLSARDREMLDYIEDNYQVLLKEVKENG